MENRKFVIIFSIVISILFSVSKAALAYETSTHAFLTKDAVDFYSARAATSTVRDFTDYLIDGSRKEDDAPRWMNHFYDPVYNRGLSMDSKIDPAYILGDWEKSKDWVNDKNNQNNLTYKVPATIASILSIIQQVKISNFSTDTDYTWNQALYYWISGEKEKAMFALGHILHTIQDVSVPDHTRNDPHPEGSIYEKWSGQYTLNNPDKNLLSKLANKNLLSLDKLGSYFDELAAYSNNNFYSKDTIGIQSGYDKPEPGFTYKEGDYFYGLGNDKEGNAYKLFVKERQGLLGSVITTTGNIVLFLNKKGGDNVVSDYWSLLSPKAVQYSASVIDFFFKEADRLKNDPQFVKKKSFFAEVIDLVGQTITSFFNTAKEDAGLQGEKLLAEVPLHEQKENVGGREIVDENLQSTEESTPIQLEKEKSEVSNEPESSIEPAVDERVRTEEDQNKNIETEDLPKQESKQSAKLSAPTENKIPTPEIPACSFSINKKPSYQNILINEVAWMGSGKSANDEWVELKNISGAELDISNWHLFDKEEQINVVFPAKTKISAGGFLLLERTDDNSVPGVKADIIYTGALSNSNEALKLFDNKCDLVDEVFANSEWPAGDSGARVTMERRSALVWQNFSGAGEGSGENTIFGTPKKENSQPLVSSGSGAGASTPVVDSSANNQQVVENNSQSEKVLINEIIAYPVESRFIELYNSTNSAISLTNWYIQRKTQTGDSFSSLVSKTYFENKTIPAHGYFLISRGNLEGTDIVMENLTITESNTIQIKNASGEIVDKVGWGGATDCEGTCAANVSEGQSIQRKFENSDFADTNNNAADFELRNCPTPKTRDKTCAAAAAEANQAPSAFFVVSTSTPQIGETVIFNATSSTDPDGLVSLYEWNFGDGSISSTTIATTTHAYLAGGDYIASLTVYDDDAATSSVSASFSVTPAAQATSTTPELSIEDVDYFILNYSTAFGYKNGSEAQLFKPLATGVIESLSASGEASNYGSTGISWNLHEWLGGATTSPEIGKGTLLAMSGEQEIFAGMGSFGTTWNFGEENKIVLDASKYYYLEIKYRQISGDLRLKWRSSDENGDNFYMNIRAARDGEVKISSPISNYIYADANVNFAATYLEPVAMKYDTAVIKTSDFYTGEIVSNETIGFDDDQKKIGWHSLSRSLQISGPGFYKVKIILTDKSAENNFSVNGSISPTDILLNQTAVSSGFSVRDLDQSFRVADSGKIDFVVLKLATGGNGWSDTFLKIYEWTGGETNSSAGTKGQLLATSTILHLEHNTAYGLISDFVWDFIDENEITLDAEKYYYLELGIEQSSIGAAPELYFAGSTNGSLIDGRLYSAGDVEADLYMIINAKQNPS